jgi:glutathione S-transferase
MALVRRNPAFADPRQVEASLAEWTRMMTILEDRLAGTRAHVGGPDFTLADIPIGLSVNRWFMTPTKGPALAAVTQYYDRLNERPGFRKHGRNGTA